MRNSDEYEIKTPKIEENLLEDDDEEEDDEASSRGGLLGKIALFFLAFALGVGVTALYFTQFYEKDSLSTPEFSQTVLEEMPEQIPAPIPVTLHDLLVEGVSFGDTVTEMVLENGDLFALSSQGNHYGLFTGGLTLPWNEGVSLRNIFYFYDEAREMHSVQYLIKPAEEVLSPAEISLIVTELSDFFPLFYSGEGFYVWQVDGGFVGFHEEYMYLYLSETEEHIREVFPEEENPT